MAIPHKVKAQVDLQYQSPGKTTKLGMNGDTSADEHMAEVNDIVLAACRVATTEET